MHSYNVPFQVTLSAAFPLHICVQFSNFTLSQKYISCKNVQTLPTGQIRQARSHREMFPTPPSEVSHKQDLDTDPSQIWKSQQVSETKEREN